MDEPTCSTPTCDRRAGRKGMCVKCYQRAWYLQRRGPLPPRTCQECSAEFMPGSDGGRLKYCSEACYEIANARSVRAAGERLRYRPRETDACLNCGVPITHLRRNAKACSPKCADRLKYLASKPAVIARSAAWAMANPEKVAAMVKRHRRAHPHRAQEVKARRRLRELGNPGSVGISERDWQRLMARYRGCCAYCGKQPKRMEKDHVIPVSRGGRHAIGNVLPACRSCNSSKNDKLLAVWRYKYLPLARKAAA